MCAGSTLSVWQAEAVRHLLAVPGIELALLIEDAGVVGEAPASTVAKIRRQEWRKILFLGAARTFMRPSCNAPVDMSATYVGVPAVRCAVRKQGKWSQYFQPDDIATIRGYNLDFVLRFAYNIIRGEILQVPRYGVWSFHHDDEEYYRGAPPCFWEIYHRDPVTGALLQRLTDRLDGGVVLRKGFFRTLDHSYSANVNHVYLRSAHWPALVARDIQHGLATYAEAAPSKSTAPIFYLPTNGQFVRFGLKVLGNKLRRVFDFAFRQDEWNVGVVETPIQRFLDPAFQPVVKLMPRPAEGTFMADTFGIERPDGSVELLVEDLDYRTNRGIIRVIPWDLAAARPTGPGRVVLDLPVHLSYPYLFEADGARWMVPEMAGARCCKLYREHPTTGTWDEIATLVTDEAVVDPTIFRHDGRWWLFYTTLDSGPDDTLFISYADELRGPWLPHARNPIRTDIRSARPAGTPFLGSDGALYRPAQDCSKTYGWRVQLNRLDALTPTEFSETPVRVVASPDGFYRDGFHTLAAAGPTLTVVDVKRRRFIPAALVARVRAVLRR